MWNPAEMWGMPTALYYVSLVAPEIKKKQKQKQTKTVDYTGIVIIC